MKLNGKVWKFEDNVDTDMIIPARFLNVSEKKELARNSFADVRPEFVEKVKPGDIIVAGRNFGCGSSREHAPIAIKAAGVSVIIAESFARIFYRNAFNIGLPVLESRDASIEMEENDQASVDLSTGEIENTFKDKTYKAKPIPDFMMSIIKAGGLVNFIKRGKHDE